MELLNKASMLRYFYIKVFCKIKEKIMPQKLEICGLES